MLITENLKSHTDNYDIHPNLITQIYPLLTILFTAHESLKTILFL